MTQEITVQLGIPITDTNYTYDSIAEKLYISGPALESGLWVGTDGKARFYPKDVIQLAAPGFRNCDLVCEHLNQTIGRVTEIELTESGFAVKNAVVTHKPSIKAILSGDKKGFSIKANVFYDSTTGIVGKIWRAEHIALVANPACKVCGITSAHTSQGTVIMSEETSTNVGETPTIEVDSASSVGVEENIADPTPTEETIAPADVTGGVPSETTVNMSGTPAVTNININFDEFEELKVSLSAATDTLTSIATRLQEVELSLTSTKTELSSTKVELSSAKDEVVKANSEIEAYKTKAEELQRIIDAREQEDRNAIISEIKGLDPEIDAAFVDSMNTVQLSAYKDSIERFTSKGMIVGEKKSTKVDASTELSAPKIVLNSDEDSRKIVYSTIFKSLKTQIAGK